MRGRLLVFSLLLAVGCGGQVVPPITNPDTQSIVGQGAILATRVVDHASTALDAVDPLVDAKVISRETARAIAGEGIQLGLRAKILANVSREYLAVRSVQNYRNMQEAIRSIRAIVDAILGHVSEGARERVRVILTPLLEAVLELDLLANPTLPAPGSAFLFLTGEEVFA